MKKIRKYYPVLLVVLLVAAIIISVYRANKRQQELTGEYTVRLTSDNFNKNISEGIVLVDFWASWCHPCRLQGPIIDRIAEEKRNVIKVGKLNVDDNKSIARKYGVSTIPTMIIFKDGKEVKRFIGYTGKGTLLNTIENHIPKNEKLHQI